MNYNNSPLPEPVNSRWFDLSLEKRTSIVGQLTFDDEYREGLAAAKWLLARIVDARVGHHDTAQVVAASGESDELEEFLLCPHLFPRVTGFSQREFGMALRGLMHLGILQDGLVQAEFAEQNQDDDLYIINHYMLFDPDALLASCNSSNKTTTVTGKNTDV